jgi:hypothetical protein
LAKHSINSKRQKTLLIVKASEASRISSDIKNIAVAGWDEEIELLALDDKNLPHAETRVRTQENSYNILTRHAEQNFAFVIIQEGVALDIKYLETEGLPIRRVKSRLTLIKVVVDELEGRNLHWHGRAMSEWSKSSIPCASPDVLVQQFAELGHSQIGRQLLKSLRVVTEADLRAAFRTSDSDGLGLHVIHAFVHDDEPGSSSIAVKNVLEHLYPPGIVVKIDIADLAEIARLEADIVYVYEDGLWSGVELVKRLNAICETSHFKESNIQLHFKYGVTSDAGLVAARLFAKRERIGRLQFRAATNENHFTFLKTGVDTCFRQLTDRTDNGIRKALDAEIEPYAFRSAAGWEGDRLLAISVCSSIGEQLIRPFLERRELEKVGRDKDGNANSMPDSISEEKVARWGLGALGFASTIVFASSIPKPVLPLFWLNGQVSLGGKTVQWRPLFWDARRTGSADRS